jgi:hypothetical protein
MACGSKARRPEFRQRILRRLHPWIRGEMDHVIRIDPKIVTGFELVKHG